MTTTTGQYRKPCLTSWKQATTDTSVPTQVTVGPKASSATRHCTKCAMKNPSPKGHKAKIVNVSSCPTYEPWCTCSKGLRLCLYWLTSLQTSTRKALHKPAGNDTCRPQAGRNRIPLHNETTPLSMATCPQQGTLVEDQHEGVTAATGCHTVTTATAAHSLLLLYIF